MIAAAAASGGGLPLWAVCAVAFVAILAVALLALLGPMAKAARDAARSRLDEVQRYRVLGALEDDREDDVPVAHQERRVVVRVLAVADRMLRARGARTEVLERLERAGLRMRPEEWVTLQVAVPIVLALLLAVAISPLAIPVGALLGWGVCRMFLRFKSSRRRSAFEDQLPDSLQLLSGALRTGFALNQAIGTVVREGTDPVATEFGRALHEVRLGANLEDALDDLARRMDSSDMALVVMAIRTAREVGGNLAEVLETTVATMRERSHLRGQVKALSAEGRFSAKVLIALPLLMAAYLLVFKRGYLEPLYTTGVGIVLLVVGCTLLVIGSVWLTRMTKIEV
jgi:tight adherence protein B